MSLKCLSIDRDLCRCCLVEGSFADLAQPYVHDGREEIYSDMIKDTFDLEIRPVPGQLCVVTYKICSDCIQRLREACRFRELVVASEARFRDLYQTSMCQVDIVSVNQIKDETDSQADDKDSFELPNSLEDDDNDDNDCSIKLDGETEELAKLKELSNSPVNVSDEDGEVEFDMKLETDDESDSSIPLPVVNKRQTLAREVKKVAKKKEKRPPKAKQTQKPKPKPKEKKEKKQTVRKKIVKEESKGEDAEGSQPKKRPGARKFFIRPEDFKLSDGRYHCSHCDQNYADRKQFRKHLMLKHYDVPRYICPVCSESFNTNAPFVNHKRFEHNIDDRFKCNACKAAFCAKAHLNNHYKTYHMLGPIYKCKECQYETFNSCHLKKHMYKHKSVKDLHCRFCKKSFVRKRNLELHERIHTGDRRKVCKECDKAFVQKASLNYHMTKYHPEVTF